MKKDLVSFVVVTRNRKRDLDSCLKSLIIQTHRNTEIIVVDNASDADQKEWINNKYKKVKVIRSDKNLGGAGGRNLGIEYAKGNYLLFIDDDAEADKNLVKELLKIVKRKNIGIVQPKIYDKDKPDVLQGIGHGFNFLTGRVFGIGIREKDVGQYDIIREIPMAGCTWMAKKSTIDKIGDYDEDLFIPYEDSDFSWRARKGGYKVVFVPKAKVWHQGLKLTKVHKRLQYLGITTPDKAYRISRNKIIFMKKHAPLPNLLLFLVLLLPTYSLIHSLIILSTGNINVFLNYWKGNVSGLIYIFRHLLT